jgi:hypothetical protein
MDYKLICNLDTPYTHNGRSYSKGETIIERVVLTESEAETMNLRQTETKLVPIQDPEVVKSKKVKSAAAEE